MYMHMEIVNNSRMCGTNVKHNIKISLQVVAFFSSPEPLGSLGELIGYPWIRRPSSVVRPSSVRPHFQTSSTLKRLGQSKPNFMWSLIGKGERKFV